MKGLELISTITEEQKILLLESENNYKRFARLYFEIIEVNNNSIVVKSYQQENKAEKYLTAKEIIERAHDVFDILGYNVHVRPIVFVQDDLSKVDSNYIIGKMNELSLGQKDLVKMLNISKSNISAILSEGRMTRSNQAMFFYLFKYLELKNKLM